MGTGSFLGVKNGRGVTLTLQHILGPLVMKQQSYTSTLPMDRTELYLYSSYGPYGLYRASVPVQGCTLPYLIT